MVGAKMHEKPELCRLSSAFSGLNSKDDLTSIGISNVESLIAQLLLDDRHLRSYVHDASDNTDNNPFVQYSRKINKNTDEEVLKFLVNTQIDYNAFLQEQGNCIQEINNTIAKIKQFNESLKQQMVPFSGSL
jgi:hypothetical protein